MSQIVQDVALSPDGQRGEGIAWRTTTFALFYSGAILGVLALVSAFPDLPLVLLRSGLHSFLWRTCILLVAACVAIGFYLLLFAHRSLAAALLILAIAHTAVGAIAFWLMSLDTPALSQEIFFLHGVYLWLVVAALSAALAYWNRRRWWRIQRPSSEAPSLQPRVLPSITTLDCVYLAAVLVAMGLFQKWAQGPMAESLPMGILIVGLMAAVARLALSPGGRGFSPVAVMVTGLACLSVGLLFVGYLYPRESILLFALFGIPLVLWSGVLLSLRGDGFRMVRDFSAIVDKEPFAEPDPLA